ncbi:hypothetical protein DP120_04650 [Planococcus halotolerans]|uniref:Uncharacterized protein n=1 Tax=Planococcus halotolerans TaxID=2233542 RepID=A0A365L0G4_9BACL|nr:hypothetical protein DP120_04650 [Planococcus halotolerans]
MNTNGEKRPFRKSLFSICISVLLRTLYLQEIFKFYKSIIIDNGKISMMKAVTLSKRRYKSLFKTLFDCACDFKNEILKTEWHL